MQHYQTPDPWFTWSARGLFFVLAVYIVWTLYAQRRQIAAFLAVCSEHVAAFAGRVWSRWGPLLSTRTFWGGIIMYVSWRTQTTIPPEVQNVGTDVLFALAQTVGLGLVGLGRIFARGSLLPHILGHSEPLIGAGAQAEISGETYRPRDGVPEWTGEQFQEFLRGPPDPTPESVRDPVPPPKRVRRPAGSKRSTPKTRRQAAKRAAAHA